MGNFFIVGQLTRMTKSTRRHSKEIISAIHLLQAAHVYLNQYSFNQNFAQFLLSCFGYSNTASDLKIRLLHRTQQQHPLSSIFFPRAVIANYDVLYIGNVRISTIHYSRRKKADDSNIIFRHSNASTFGHVCSIFSVNNNQPLLLIDYLETTIPLQCTITSGNTNFSYEHIRHGDTSTKKTCIIEIHDFIEKCAYFQSPEGISYYSRFPTLCHSS